MSQKILNIKHKESGKEYKIAWEGDKNPTDDQIDKIVEQEESRKNLHKAPFPVADPQVWKDAAVDSPTNQSSGQNVQDPLSDRGMDDDDADQEDDNGEGVDEQNVDDDSQNKSFLDYHDTLDKLDKDPDHYGHVMTALLHAKKAGVSSDDMDKDLENCGTNEECRKAAKELHEVS